MRLPFLDNSVADRAWRWVFPSRTVTLELRTDVDGAMRALRERAVPPGIRHALRGVVVARLDDRNIEVWCRKLLLKNNAAPTFVGRFTTTDGRMYLVGELRADRSNRIMFGTWVAIVSIMWVVEVATTVILARSDLLSVSMALLAPPLMIALAAGVTRWGWRLGRSDGARIESLLREAIASAPQSPPLIVADAAIAVP